MVVPLLIVGVRPAIAGSDAKNRYLIPGERKEPDGRCAPTNGQFALPLKRGRNDVVVAVANGFYGWGLIFQTAGRR